MRYENQRKSQSLEYRSESLRVCIGNEPEDGRVRELIPLNVSRAIRIVDGDKTRNFTNFSFLLNHKFMIDGKDSLSATVLLI